MRAAWRQEATGRRARRPVFSTAPEGLAITLGHGDEPVTCLCDVVRMALVTSTLRQLLGLTIMIVAVALFSVICVFLLPWRTLRIRVCNVFGHIVGRTILAVTGTHLTGHDRATMGTSMPAIYISNHTSPIDIFLGIWLSPLGVCGVAKKEVIWYPFFGQLYLVSGHLRIDRSNRGSAIAALAKTADLVREHGLGIWIWPEGTRSKDGRLRAFKKGFAHLALHGPARGTGGGERCAPHLAQEQLPHPPRRGQREGPARDRHQPVDVGDAR